MEYKIFTSEQTKDILELNIPTKNHSAIFSVKRFDKVSENIKLLGELITYLKRMDKKWVIIKEKFSFERTENMLFYNHKITKDLHCHIEDFEKFYIKNISNFIKPSNIYINIHDEENDGWTTVIDVKKKRINKIKALKKEVKNIVSDWNYL